MFGKYWSCTLRGYVEGLFCAQVLIEIEVSDHNAYGTPCLLNYADMETMLIHNVAA